KSEPGAAGGRFEKAVELAEKAVRDAGPGDGFTLIHLAGGADTVIPGPSNDPEKVLAEIRALKPTHGTADLAAGLAAAADVLGRSPRSYPRRQVLLFTDLQRSALAPLLPRPDAPPPDIWNRVLSRADVAVVDAATADVDNLAVADFGLADPLPLAGAPTAVTAAVQNFGKTDRKQVRVELSLGRPSAAGADLTLLPVEQRVLDAVPAGQRVAVTFALDGAARFREAGVHLLQVRILDGDDLPADDVRNLAVEVRAGLPAVLVNGTPAADPLKRAAEYLSEALDPGGRRLPGNPARPRVVSLAEFADAGLGDLTGADAVFLCDVPAVSPAQVARLDAHLKRGGGVVIGLGPNAAANLDGYNRTLFADGNGLLPGKLLGVKAADGPDDPGFRLAADDDAYRRPPLSGFRDDNARAGLVGVPFRKYVRLDAPADGRARRILSFVPAATPGEKEEKTEKPAASADRPDPAVVEWPRHRGRVVVYTSTFNADWTDWPLLPSYLPFAHELLRFAAANPDRHTVRVGDPLEEFLPAAVVGMSASVSGPGGISATVPVVAGDEIGVARYTDTAISGLYRIAVGGRRDGIFAVNVPEVTPGGGSESDLRRVDPAELRAVGSVQVVTDPGAVRVGGDGETVTVTQPRPHGPSVARWLIAAAAVMAVLELWLAWRLGPARTALPASANAANTDTTGRGRRLARMVLGVGPVVVAGGLLLTVAHAKFTGDLLGFLPDSWRSRAEQAVGVPAAGPGEGTRWRLEGVPAFLADHAADGRLVAGLVLVGVGVAAVVYRLERRAAGGSGRLVVPFLLRIGVLFLAAFVLLPQLRLAFDREGWPDVAVLIDTSGSMGTVDDLRDPAVRAKAEELGRLGGVGPADRLRLAKALLARPDGDFLSRILTGRQYKVHVYGMADRPRLLKEIAEPADLESARTEITGLTADAEASRLGDSVAAVLKAFRGGSLAAVVVLSDGIVTAGDELPKAGRDAARAGVPLFVVGLGDAREPPDLILSDLKADDVVLKGDQLVFEARVTARGPDPAKSVPVVLYERLGDRLFERARQTVRPDPAGKPVPVRLTTVPTEVGEKTFVLDLPVQPGETETGNNRLERVVLVTESKKLRVLYVEGYPRYEFRFVKALLERETDAIRGNKSIELATLLLDASPGYAEQDKSALRALPTKAELLEYDVVILGDVDPAALPKAAQFFADLQEFVKARQGGLLLIAGEQANPHKLFGTPLADLLPVLPADVAPPKPGAGPADPDGYRPKLTPFGQTHPLFRFAADDADNAKVWADLRPLGWAASAYRRKQTAEVLAVHPTRPADGGAGENHPLVLQQFVGGGRVVFLGFDDTWRWRFRQGEERFNRFWVQAIRLLARSRVTRTEVRTDRQTASRRDEPIRLTVRFPDDAPPPPADQPVRVTVDRTPLKNPDGTTTGPVAES
ncbi:MAG: VWA domain-containing protein, partial [Fimbriiglobus sp.]